MNYSVNSHTQVHKIRKASERSSRNQPNNGEQRDIAEISALSHMSSAKVSGVQLLNELLEVSVGPLEDLSQQCLPKTLCNLSWGKNVLPIEAKLYSITSVM